MEKVGKDGVVTVEDLAEELVGELTDEHDAEEHHISHEAGVGPDNDQWRIAGDEHLDEVARVLQRELPTTSAQTLSGLVIEHLRGFPEVGDRVSIELPIDPADLSGNDTPETERLVIDVIEVATHVPARLRIGIEVAR